MRDASARQLAKRRAPPPPPPLDPAAKERARQQFEAAVLPLFANWQATVNGSAVRLGLLSETEVREGRSLTPPPELATLTVWGALDAWGAVTENMGKWLATIAVATVIGGGYALPTYQLYRAAKTIAAHAPAKRPEAEPVRVVS